MGVPSRCSGGGVLPCRAMLETTIIGGHAPRSPPRALNPRSSPGSVMHLVGNAPEGPALPDSARQPIDASLDGIGCRARPKCTHDPCDPDDDNARVLDDFSTAGSTKIDNLATSFKMRSAWRTDAAGPQMARGSMLC